MDIADRSPRLPACTPSGGPPAEFICERPNGQPFAATLLPDDTIDSFLGEIVARCGPAVITKHFKQAGGPNTYRLVPASLWTATEGDLPGKDHGSRSQALLLEPDTWIRTKHWLRTTKPRLRVVRCTMMSVEIKSEDAAMQCMDTGASVIVSNLDTIAHVRDRMCQICGVEDHRTHQVKLVDGTILHLHSTLFDVDAKGSIELVLFQLAPPGVPVHLTAEAVALPSLLRTERFGRARLTWHETEVPNGPANSFVVTIDPPSQQPPGTRRLEYPRADVASEDEEAPLSRVIKGLVNGTEYNITLCAANAVGVSEAVVVVLKFCTPEQTTDGQYAKAIDDGEHEIVLQDPPAHSSSNWACG